MINALELAMALPIERLSLNAMRHMLSAVLASWTRAMMQEDEDAQQDSELQDEQLPDELASLSAFHHPASRATPTILHERRLHALARYVAKRTQEVPADMCQDLLSHVDALRERGDNEYGALALSCLGLPPPARASLPRHPDLSTLCVLACVCSSTLCGRACACALAPAHTHMLAPTLLARAHCSGRA